MTRLDQIARIRTGVGAVTKNITVKDVAQLLGISHTTVSRALAGSNKISNDTKERVRAAAAQLGYVAHSGARLMRQGQTSIVGLVVPNVVSEFYSGLSQTLATLASAKGRQLILALSNDDPDQEEKLVRAMMEARPDTIIAALCDTPHPNTVAMLQKTKCIQFLRIHPDLPQNGVTTDGSVAAQIAVKRLYEAGHRRIAFIGLDSSTIIGRLRYHGYLKALAEHGLTHDPALDLLDAQTVEGGERTARKLIAMESLPTALYLSNPIMAVGAARVLKAHGFDDPTRLSVISSGTATWHEFWPGGMTTVALPIEEMAEVAAQMVLGERSESGDEPVLISIAPTLLEGGSVAQIKLS